ncbi:hypothetical protein COY27_01190 [Candidatus Woesearchaeota archaeon CG_4_10_14_0_2_um_filter_33_13]|nr:MAG: hypothetical protein COY27_01190 [Candidatus Woesearchaeota archaeon CG_4_10_14_0_2_um_filter_33_13]
MKAIVESEIKYFLLKFLKTKEYITKEQIVKLERELSVDNPYYRLNNLHVDLRDYVLGEFIRRHFKPLELWEKVVVENAKINNEPHKVADEVIKKYQENFFNEEDF